MSLTTVLLSPFDNSWCTWRRCCDWIKVIESNISVMSLATAVLLSPYDNSRCTWRDGVMTHSNDMPRSSLFSPFNNSRCTWRGDVMTLMICLGLLCPQHISTFKYQPGRRFICTRTHGVLHVILLGCSYDILGHVRLDKGSISLVLILEMPYKTRSGGADAVSNGLLTGSKC